MQSVSGPRPRIYELAFTMDAGKCAAMQAASELELFVVWVTASAVPMREARVPN